MYTLPIFHHSIPSRLFLSRLPLPAPSLSLRSCHPFHSPMIVPLQLRFPPSNMLTNQTALRASVSLRSALLFSLPLIHVPHFLVLNLRTLRKSPSCLRVFHPFTPGWNAQHARRQICGQRCDSVPSSAWPQILCTTSCCHLSHGGPLLSTASMSTPSNFYEPNNFTSRCAADGLLTFIR